MNYKIRFNNQLMIIKLIKNQQTKSKVNMNKSVSLPRIRKNSQTSRAVSIKSGKNIVDERVDEQLNLQKNSHNQNNQSLNQKYKIKAKSQSLRHLRSESLKNKSEQSKQGQVVKQKKFGLGQNGRLSKITEISTVSKILSTERSKSSTNQRQDKKKVSHIKKQLNQVTSGGLILKKQIKAMQGRIAQLKQQIAHFKTQNPTETNGIIEQKLQQTNRKIEFAKYDRQIYKNMKERLKKILIYYEKKTISQRQQLQKQQKRNKILADRNAVKQESINKKKYQFKRLQQTQRMNNKMTELQVDQYKKKIRMMNEQNQMNIKNSAIKIMNQDEYHYDVYKKQQHKLMQKYHANVFIDKLLSIKWNSHSQHYLKQQKAQKLMQMHSIQKLQQQFDPRKVYFGSFQTKKQLQSQIKNKQIIMNQTLKKNIQLKKKWEEIQFKQIEQQEKILDNTDMKIKTGKIQQKELIEKQKKQFMHSMKHKLELSKERAAKISRIKDWILKIEQSIGLNPLRNTQLQDRLAQIINFTRKQNQTANKNHLIR